MAGVVIWMMLIGVIGMMVGGFCWSGLLRTIWTVVFGLAWFGMLRGHGQGALIALAVGICVFLIGMWIGSAMAKNTALDRIAGATTDELHEAILSLIDEHGDDHSWVGGVWLRMEDQDQRRWIRQHRSEIKLALKHALKRGEVDPFWDTLAGLWPRRQSIPPPAPRGYDTPALRQSRRMNPMGGDR